MKVKLTSDGITARYRLDLSDGITSLAAFVNSQSTAVIANQGIREYTVIRVTNYRCCVMKDIKMMILNDFEKIQDLDHAIDNKYEEKKPHIPHPHQQYTSITSYDQEINNLKNEVNLLRSELFLTEDMKTMLHDQEIELKKSKNDLKKYKNELKKSNTEISELKTFNSVILSELNDLKHVIGSLVILRYVMACYVVRLKNYYNVIVNLRNVIALYLVNQLLLIL